MTSIYAYVGNDQGDRTDPTRLDGGCVYTPRPLRSFRRCWEHFPLAGAAEELDKGHYATAAALGVLDIGLPGEGRLIGSLGSPLGRALAAAVRGALKSCSSVPCASLLFV